MNNAILTKIEAQKCINAQKLGHSYVLTSLDLNKSTEKVFFEGKKVLFKSEGVSLKSLKKLKENTCYLIENDKLKAIAFFGEDTNIFYKLKPTKDWPTITLSSVPMHRFKHFSPKEDTKTRIDEINPVVGCVLDTCCGLGYTAISAANSSNLVNEVITFEKDENVLRIAQHNPYSEELFTNPKIKLKKESVFDGIKNLPNNYFDRIIHDPPTVSFAKELYSEDFYKELFRVLKSGGILYHYCPNPGKTKRKEFWPTIKKLLERTGFVKCEYHEKSSGIRCIKK